MALGIEWHWALGCQGVTKVVQLLLKPSRYKMGYGGIGWKAIEKALLFILI